MLSIDEPGSGSLRDRVYGVLRQRIIETVYQPGERLIERDLAEELSVSRIPLREALRLLSADSLVVMVGGRGTIVSPFTPSDVEDLFDVRSSVEALAARLAAVRADSKQIASLRGLIEAGNRAVGSHNELSRINADFHEALVQASGNRLLLTMARPLHARLRWLFHLASNIDAIRLCSEHGAIIDAISAGDAEAAAQLALAHVEGGRERTVRMAHDWASEAVDPVKLTHSRRRGGRGRAVDTD